MVVEDLWNRPLQELPADQNACERQEAVVDICSFFVPHAKTTELIKPGKGAFHDPAPSPQTAAVFRIAHCEQGQDAAAAQSATDVVRVVGPVPEDALRPTARPTTQSLERWNGIEQWYSLL